MRPVDVPDNVVSPTSGICAHEKDDMRCQISKPGADALPVSREQCHVANASQAFLPQDKLLFALLLAVTINQAKGEVDADEWRFFLTGLPMPTTTGSGLSQPWQGGERVGRGSPEWAPSSWV